MDEKFLFCVSVSSGEHTLYGPEWKETDRGKSLIDLFVQACGTKILGQQVQVLVSKDRSFLEAAVVQVCTPLVTLLEKSQSYIQFILKTEDLSTSQNVSHLKPNISSVYPAERDDSSCKLNGLNSSFGLRDDTQIHTLTDWKDIFEDKFKLTSFRSTESTKQDSHLSKPSFENMTVQEICDEIKRIKTTELSKNKLSSWIEEKSKLYTEPVKQKCNNKVLQKPTRDASTSKTNKRLKDSSVNSLSNQVKKKFSQQKPSSPTLSRSRHVTRLTESARNKINLQQKASFSPLVNTQTSEKNSKTQNSLIGQKPERTKTNTANVNSTLKNITKSFETKQQSMQKPTTTRSLSSSPKSLKTSNPATDRLSILSQPRRNRSEPTKLNMSKSQPLVKKDVSKKKSTSVKKSESMSTQNLNMTRKDKLNSTFVKEKMVVLKEKDSSEIFVEIFTKEKGEVINSTKSFDVNNVSHSNCSDYSFMNQTDEKCAELPCQSKSRSEENIVSVDDMLSKIHGDTLTATQEQLLTSEHNSVERPIDEKNEIVDGILNVKNGNIDRPLFFDSQTVNNKINQPVGLPDKRLEENDLSSSNDDEVVFDKTNNSITSSTKECEEDSDEKIMRLAKEILNNKDKSIENVLDYLSLSTQKSPVKALFSPLLDKRNIKHMHLSPDKLSSTSLNTSLENQTETIKNKASPNIGELPNKLVIECNGDEETGEKHVKEDNKDIDTDSYMWANVRGIKFTCTNVMNHAVEMQGNKDKSSTESTPMSLSLPLTKFASSPHTPDKHRKHWGKSVEGMDNMLVKSLQAFSVELRTTTENIAVNMRSLYEDWQVKYEGIDPSSFTSSKPVLPNNSPKLGENGGDQQGVAIVFRNLRKMEIKLKTIEQAIVAMVTAMQECSSEHASDNTIQRETKNAHPQKRSVSRTKSFKWTELKSAARNHIRPKSWLQQHEKSGDLSSDSDD